MNTYLYSFILVVKPWSLINVTYFTSTQTVALTVFGILGGVIMRFQHRYKWMLVVGLCIRLLYVSFSMYSPFSDLNYSQGCRTDDPLSWSKRF